MRRKPTKAVLVLQYGILILGALFAIYPLWFALIASGRTGDRLYTLNLAGMFVPLEWTFENYRTMLFDRPLLTWLRNSLYVAGITTVVSLIVTTSAAFAFSRFKFYGREFGLILLLAIQTFPGVLALVAVAQLLTALGLYGKHEGLILAYTSTTLVFSTWNMKGYFDTIPVELEEAAQIDGCGPVQSFILIALPLARPALAVTALLGFLAGWGDFIFASVLVPAPDSMKLVVPGLYSMANSQSVPWGYFAAGGLLIIIPTILVFLFLQRYLESGLTVGGVKG
ncbi:binding-protein-dependent transport systems inner membrane component [Oscillochloris trichoides DG-6]|uniref:Binding-protein-dependent transport systems inner membrane component n=1 Tax=Oscillochloris trichoides DG-6 TaxID=765420 RepID=E1IDI0_9CHLR|nr:ABC transporter permease subunit [Oscillochloris trichoides]EFO80760.1 binding-protein-dependent transport systems inner membrane component [Oscillochloris trichoides DG-6]